MADDPVSSLCESCYEEWAKWLDPSHTKNLHKSIQLITIGTDRHRVSRGERIYDTISQQQALIKKFCEERHH
jgi:hypothetical protein